MNIINKKISGKFIRYRVSEQKSNQGPSYHIQCSRIQKTGKSCICYMTSNSLEPLYMELLPKDWSMMASMGSLLSTPSVYAIAFCWLCLASDGTSITAWDQACNALSAHMSILPAIFVWNPKAKGLQLFFATWNPALIWLHVWVATKRNC